MSGRYKFTSLTKGMANISIDGVDSDFEVLVFCMCGQLNRYGRIIDKKDVLAAIKDVESGLFETLEMAAIHIAKYVSATRNIPVKVRLTEPDRIHSVEVCDAEE